MSTALYVDLQHPFVPGLIYRRRLTALTHGGGIVMSGSRVFERQKAIARIYKARK